MHMRRAPGRLGRVFCGFALFLTAGCHSNGADGADLGAFVQDFARQILAAFLF
jgi:hypothetical protein